MEVTEERIMIIRRRFIYVKRRARTNPGVGLSYTVTLLNDEETRERGFVSDFTTMSKKASVASAFQGR